MKVTEEHRLAARRIRAIAHGLITGQYTLALLKQYRALTYPEASDLLARDLITLSGLVDPLTPNQRNCS